MTRVGTALVSCLLLAGCAHIPESSPFADFETPPAGERVEYVSVDEPRSLGPVHIVDLAIDVNGGPDELDLRFPAPVATGIFVTIGRVAPDLELRIDEGTEGARVVRGRFFAHGPCEDPDDPVPFLATARLPEGERIPEGRHVVRLVGTIPVTIGARLEEYVLPWEEGSTNWEFRAGGYSLKDPETVQWNGMRHATFSAFGSAQVLEDVTFYDEAGIVIQRTRAERPGHTGFSSGGNVFGQLTVEAPGTTPIAFVGFTSWKRIEFWNVRVDVTTVLERPAYETRSSTSAQSRCDQ